MGIVNASPDSFSDGGRFATLQAQIELARELLQDGADILDIGGESASTGSPAVSVEREIERVVPLIVEAMQQSGVRRIIALGSAGALEDSLKKQPAWRRWFVQKMVYNTFLKWAVASQVAQWKTLSGSGLDSMP